MLPLVIFLALTSIAAVTSDRPALPQLNKYIDLHQRFYTDPQFHIAKARAFSGKPANYMVGGEDMGDYAMKLWMTVTFYNIYANYSVKEDPAEVKKGEDLYKTVKLSGYDEKDSAGLAHDTPHDDLLKIIQSWYDSQMIDNQTRNDLILSMNSQDFTKSSGSNSLVNGQSEISFYQVGYATTDLRGSNKAGSIAYAFYKTKFQAAPEVSTEKSTTCWIWGLICQTNYHIKTTARTFTEEESENLAAYLRHKGLRKFFDECEGMVQYLQALGNKLMPSMQAPQQDAANKVNANPGVRPDKLFDQDPFDGNKLPWSYKKAAKST